MTHPIQARNPTVWYRMNDAGLPLVNSGSVGSGQDQVLAAGDAVSFDFQAENLYPRGDSSLAIVGRPGTTYLESATGAAAIQNNGNGPFTVGYWQKRPPYNPSNTPPYGTYIWSGTGGGDYFVYTLTDDNLTIYRSDDNYDDVVSKSTGLRFDDNQPHFYTAVFRDTYATLFVDGVIVARVFHDPPSAPLNWPDTLIDSFGHSGTKDYSANPYFWQDFFIINDDMTDEEIGILLSEMMIETTGELAFTEEDDEFDYQAHGDISYSEEDDAGPGREGIVNFTEDNDTAQLQGVAAGNIVFTEEDDTAVLTGYFPGGISYTEEDDVAVLTGSVTPVGTLAFTEAPDVASLTGLVPNQGQWAGITRVRNGKANVDDQIEADSLNVVLPWVPSITDAEVEEFQRNLRNLTQDTFNRHGTTIHGHSRQITLHDRAIDQSIVRITDIEAEYKEIIWSYGGVVAPSSDVNGAPWPAPYKANLRKIILTLASMSAEPTVVETYIQGLLFHTATIPAGQTYVEYDVDTILNPSYRLASKLLAVSGGTGVNLGIIYRFVRSQ